MGALPMPTAVRQRAKCGFQTSEGRRMLVADRQQWAKENKKARLEENGND
jgi:hypothetical protein